MKNFKRTATTTAAGIGLAFCTVLIASPTMAQDDIPEPVASTSTSASATTTDTTSATTTNSNTNSASTSAASALPVTSSSSNSVRGTFVNIKNNTGGTIKIGTESSTGDRAPSVDQKDLANGDSITASEGSHSVSGTSIFAEVTYPDGTSEQFTVENPSIGNPSVKVRDAKWGVLDWSNADYDSHNFDEGESWTTDLSNGHKITFERNSDDSAGHDFSKVWTITIS